MFERLKKHWHKSKTIWFAILHGLPALVLSVLDYLNMVDLTPILGAKFAGAASIYLMVAMIVLRAITSKSLEHK